MPCISMTDDGVADEAASRGQERIRTDEFDAEVRIPAKFPNDAGQTCVLLP